MNTLSRLGDVLHVEDVSLETIAGEFATPCYVYSRAALEAAYLAYDQALAAQK